jgi:two-component system, OmpR family, response regulator
METSPHILIVDDDRELRDLLSRFLTANGFRVTVARDAREMSKALEEAAIDLVVLDVMMPGKDGFTACRELRATNDVPLIMLTAVSDPTDRIVGLELGADDYLPKPFNSRELLARMRALLRRTATSPRRVVAGTTQSLQFAGWTLDVGRRCLLSPEGTMVTLSTGEYDLLLAFLEHPQRILTRDQLLDLARGRSPVPFDRSIDVQVSRLRRKIEADPRLPQIIATVRGDGYMLATNVVRT